MFAAQGITLARDDDIRQTVVQIINNSNIHAVLIKLYFMFNLNLVVQIGTLTKISSHNDYIQHHKYKMSTLN